MRESNVMFGNLKTSLMWSLFFGCFKISIRKVSHYCFRIVSFHSLSLVVVRYKAFVSFVMLLFFAANLSAQNTSFVKAYQADQRGGIVFVSNNILSCVDCDEDVNQLPPGGTTDNNKKIGQYINIDSQPDIFSSSSADLMLPNRSEITFAGLYWGGYLTSENPRYSERNNVKLKLPGAVSYTDVKAQLSFEPYDNSYQNFADITAQVKYNGKTNGTFTLANVVANTNNINLEAGWTIVVAYKNDLKPFRNLTVFHGLAGIIHGNTGELDISISGFVTPFTGPVSYELGFVAYEGDRVRNGDYMKFNNQFITDAARPQNNILNSSITYKGSVVPSRNPAHNNTLGYDAGIIIPDNSLISDGTYKYIQNSATHASVKVATNDDSYAIGVITTSIDTYNPNFEFTHSYTNLSSPGTPLKSGETMQFEYNLKNIGNDDSKNTIVSTSLSPLLTNVTKLEVQYNNDGKWLPFSLAAADDQAEYDAGTNKINFRVGTGANGGAGGIVPVNSAVRLRFEGALTSDCDLLRCSGASFENFASVFYDGNVNSSQHFDQQSGPLSVNRQSAFGEQLQVNIEIPAQCKMLDEKSFTIACNTNVSDLSLPDGFYLYAKSDTSFSAPLNEINLPGDTYIARQALASGCDVSFNVHISLTPMTATLTKVRDALSFGSATGAIELNVNGAAYDQRWFKDGLSIPVPAKLNALKAGTYEVIVANSCQQASTAKVTISQPSESPGFVSLMPEVANVSEGKKVFITAKLSRPHEADVIITFSYAGLAQKERDYILQGQNQHILIPRGSVTTNDKIILTALTDNLEEGDEEVVVKIASVSSPLIEIRDSAAIIINDIYPPGVLPVHTVKNYISENVNLQVDPLLSPNDDGSGNNFFKIDNILSFPDNEVVIFNRFGSEVFRIKGYNESDRVFKGSPNRGVSNANSVLPDGIYFFLITTNRQSSGQSVNTLDKGYLILKR